MTMSARMSGTRALISCAHSLRPGWPLIWTEWNRSDANAPDEIRRLGSPTILVILPLPGVGIALLPKLICPACWPAYAGLLSSVGLGFLVPGSNLFILTLASLALALGAIAFKVPTRRRSRVLVLGTIGAVRIVLAKFVFNSGAPLYAGVFALIGASGWNAWLIGQEGPPPGCTRSSKSKDLNSESGNEPKTQDG